MRTRRCPPTAAKPHPPRATPDCGARPVRGGRGAVHRTPRRTPAPAPESPAAKSASQPPCLKPHRKSFKPHRKTNGSLFSPRNTLPHQASTPPLPPRSTTRPRSRARQLVRIRWPPFSSFFLRDASASSRLRGEIPSSLSGPRNTLPHQALTPPLPPRSTTRPRSRARQLTRIRWPPFSSFFLRDASASSRLRGEIPSSLSGPRNTLPHQALTPPLPPRSTTRPRSRARQLVRIRWPPSPRSSSATPPRLRVSAVKSHLRFPAHETRCHIKR